MDPHQELVLFRVQRVVSNLAKDVTNMSVIELKYKLKAVLSMMELYGLTEVKHENAKISV
jgi:hypothetical protein